MACMLCACTRSVSTNDIILSDENCVVELSLSGDDSGLIEGLYASGSKNATKIVLLDFHNGKSFSLRDFRKQDALIRFGEIGHGEKEIPLGCTGYMCDSSFVVFSDETHCIVTYDLNHIDLENTNVHRYDIENAQFCQIIPVDSNRYVGMGVYADEYQYVLFDKNDNVVTSAFRVYNYNDSHFNTFHKFLSNQGRMEKHPKQNKFVAFIYNSKNIDFFEIANDSIHRISSQREQSPNYECVTRNGLSRVLPSDNSIVGYIDLCTTDDYVYVLYSESEFMSGTDSSDIVLVYDWDGELCSRVKMPQPACYIAALDDQLLAVVETATGEYILKGYCVRNVPHIN